MPSAASLAFSPNGSQFDLFAVSLTNVLYRYNQSGGGFTPVMGGVLSVSVAYNPLGAEEIDVVMNDGSVVAYGAPVGGVQTVLPSGFVDVAAVSVAFAPDGARVREVTLQNGNVYQQDASGNYTFLTGGMNSASVAFTPGGAEVLDLLDRNNTVSRVSYPSGAVTSQPTISSLDGGGEGLTIAPNGTVIQTVVQVNMSGGVTTPYGADGQGPIGFTPTSDLVSVAIGSSAPVLLGTIS